jgi:hypothetical protein
VIEGLQAIRLFQPANTHFACRPQRGKERGTSLACR